MNEFPAVIVNIQRQPGANIIAVVDQIQELLPNLTSTLPASVHVTTLTDLTTTIRASVNDVEVRAVLTIGLVVMVIFVFLRSLSATIIPSVAVPLSLVGTFGVMYLLGYSLNNLTLMALTISTGFVVDDAIVMIENIVRFIEEGDSPMQAALEGRRTNRVHHHFADDLADRGADPSAVHGRYRGPALPRIRGHVERDHSGLRRGFAHADAHDVCAALEAHPRGIAGTLFALPRTLLIQLSSSTGALCKFVLRFQTITLLVAVATLVLTIFLFYEFPKGFFPIQDTGVIQGIRKQPRRSPSARCRDCSSSAAQVDSERPGR